MARVARSILALLAALPSLLVGASIVRTTEAADPEPLALFKRGVDRMNEGACTRSPVGDRALCEAAIDDFGRAFQLDPLALGALRNRARCQAALGRVASAHRDLTQLARLAEIDERPERRAWAEPARKEAARLEARIPRLVVRLAAGVRDLHLDGVAIAPGEQPIPVDPGTHVLRATAPDGRAIEREFSAQEGNRSVIELRPEPAVVERRSDPPPIKSEPLDDARPAWPMITLLSGVVVTASGLGIGYAAIRTRADVCTADVCTDRATYDRGRRLADVSTVVTAVGATAMVVGVVGLVWPRDGGRRVSIGVTPRTGGVAFDAAVSF
jgi:hypothetical protein